MTSTITPELVRLDEDLGGSMPEALSAMAGIVAQTGRTDDPEKLAADAAAREQISPTGLPGGIAIPHCRTSAVEVLTLAFARISPKVDFGATDGDADLVFMILAPVGGEADHLNVLAKLARALLKPEFADSLRAASTPQQVVDRIAPVLP